MHTVAVQKTNWTKCCICQQDTKEKLIQPSLFNREQDRAGYDNIARNNTKLERASSTAADDTEDEIRVNRPRTPQPSPAVGFICERVSPTTALREAMTMKVNDRLNECAGELSDEKLIAKLRAGDAVAQEFKYHPACLVGMYNREQALFNTLKYDQNPESSVNHNLYPSAFSEFAIYMDMKTTSEGTDTVKFKLADLVPLNDISNLV